MTAWSVRLRVTLLATLTAAALLAVASLVLLQLVERSLVSEAEQVLASSLAEFTDEIGDLGGPEGGFFQYRTEQGVVFLGVVNEDDELLVPVTDPRTGYEIGAVVLDSATHTILEAWIGEVQVPITEIPQQTLDALRLIPPGEDGGTIVAAVPLEGVRSTLATLRGSLAVVLPVLALALGMLVWWLVGVALAPIARMTARAEQIGSGTLGDRLPEARTGDEVGRLARVLNAMLARIEQGVVRERQFVADASHELRTPLATIRAAAELVTMRRAVVEGAAAWDGPADDVLAEVDRLDALIGDLLVMARLDDGRSVGTESSVDLGDLARRTVEDWPDARVVLVEPVPDRVLVWGQPGLLTRMLTNLLSNACRYAGERVTVTVAGGAVAVGLTVDDDGPGIPTPDRERVFERFVRLDEARGQDGFGLGLAIVRAIAGQHGGIALASGSPLGGARVTVSLPAASARDGTGGH